MILDNCPPMFANVARKCLFFSSTLYEKRNWQDSRQFCLSMSDGYHESIDLAMLEDEFQDYNDIVQYMNGHSE